MPKTWAEVSGSAEYQALPAADKEAARNQYYEMVVAPQVPQADQVAARAQFDSVSKSASLETPQPSWTDRIRETANGFLEKLKSGAGTAMDMAGGARDNMMSMATAIPASIIGGLDATSATLGNMVFDKQVDPAKRGEDTASALTYQPPTPTGQKIQQLVNSPMAALENISDSAGEGVSNATGMPILGTATKTALQMAPSMLDPALRGMRAMKGPPVLEPLPRQGPVTEDMTPPQAHAQNVETLLANDVRLASGQRGRGFLDRQIASLGRAGEDVFGPSWLPAEQGQDFTKAVLGKIDAAKDTGTNNLPPARATPDVMARVKSNIGDTYDDLTTRIDTGFDQQLVSELRGLRNTVNTTAPMARELTSMIDTVENSRQVNPAYSQWLQKRAANVPKPPKYVLDGETAQNIRSELGRMEMSTQNSSLSHWSGELKGALDNAFERSAPPDDAAAMRQVRRDVQKVKAIEPSIDQNGVISPKRLYQQLATKRGKGTRVYGEGDQGMTELAKAGSAVLPDTVGNSGTTPRAAGIAKVVGMIRHPIRTSAELGLLGVGKGLAEMNPQRGMRSVINARNIAKQAPPPTLRKAQIGIPLTAETPEQKRRRQMAEALQGVR